MLPLLIDLSFMPDGNNSHDKVANMDLENHPVVGDTDAVDIAYPGGSEVL